MEYKVICFICGIFQGKSEKDNDIFVCCEDCYNKIPIKNRL